ncbi:MAG: hypothetical protein HC786_20245 [Richelia sp. CSU_2_1]|nr:hypothetical protein [Richelia sp. CSU_2_1]
MLAPLFLVIFLSSIESSSIGINITRALLKSSGDDRTIKYQISNIKYQISTLNCFILPMTEMNEL